MTAKKIFGFWKIFCLVPRISSHLRCLKFSWILTRDELRILSISLDINFFFSVTKNHTLWIMLGVNEHLPNRALKINTKSNKYRNWLQLICGILCCTQGIDSGISLHFALKFSWILTGDELRILCISLDINFFFFCN